MTDSWVVTSWPLRRLVSLRYGKAAFVLENGVGPDLVARGLTDGASALPRERKVIYYGAFDERFDLQLVNRLAELLEEMTFDLYGPSAPNGPLHPRVHYCGYLQYSLISDTLSRYEFGILPFTREIMNHCRFPMKLWEMLACGLQVIAPPIGSLRRFRADGKTSVWISRSWSAESLADCFKEASTQPGRTLVDEIESQSWSHKAIKLLQHLHRPATPEV
jgi:teichuronic acid biosynthesis glycosyltransferase TuaH